MKDKMLGVPQWVYWTRLIPMTLGMTLALWLLPDAFRPTDMNYVADRFGKPEFRVGDWVYNQITRHPAIVHEVHADEDTGWAYWVRLVDPARGDWLRRDTNGRSVVQEWWYAGESVLIPEDIRRDPVLPTDVTLTKDLKDWRRDATVLAR